MTDIDQLLARAEKAEAQRDAWQEKCHKAWDDVDKQANRAISAEMENQRLRAALATRADDQANAELAGLHDPRIDYELRRLADRLDTTLKEPNEMEIAPEPNYLRKLLQAVTDPDGCSAEVLAEARTAAGA